MRDTSCSAHIPGIHTFSDPQRRLVALMRSIRFGRIENLSIADGEPVFDRTATVVREIKFGGGDDIPTVTTRGESQPKTQVVELLEYLRSMKNGVVEVLEVKHGLPFRMSVKEMAGA